MAYFPILPGGFDVPQLVQAAFVGNESEWYTYTLFFKFHYISDIKDASAPSDFWPSHLISKTEDICTGARFLLILYTFWLLFRQHYFVISAGEAYHAHRRKDTQTLHAERRHVCTTGRAEYRRHNLNRYMNLHDDFRNAVCQLPTKYDNSTKPQYIAFIDEFGTVRCHLLSPSRHTLMKWWVSEDKVT